MAINTKIGQDSEGYPVYKRDEHGKPTHELDQDLDIIFEAWQSHKSGRLKDSEYVFSIDAKILDDKTLRLNPQFYLPALNRTLQRIISLDGNGFSVERLGDKIATKIWKGTRFKREDLETKSPNLNTVEYFTPSSIFMYGVGTKYLDLSSCQERRKGEILSHRAKHGEILITRSGTLGRVLLVGNILEGKILSDDLIRIWIEDLGLRAFVFAFLRSPGGQDQMLRNEYGTVQQHLEPYHIADLLIPLPDNESELSQLMDTVTAAISANEKAIELGVQADAQMIKMLGWD
jgi:restriction endonuclease S subunit